MTDVKRTDGIKRREALLDAALACFIERGVLATGIEDIRKAAGASPSSVYHQFAGLGALVIALLTRTFERLFAHLGARVGAARGAEATVLALVDGHLEWVLANRDEARFMYQAMAVELGADEAGTLAAAKAKLLQPIAAHIAALVAAGELPDWSPLVFDLVLLGPSHEACRRFLGGAPLSARWMRATLPLLAWRVVAPAQAKRTRRAATSSSKRSAASHRQKGHSSR
jgi:AcrR family transcriptional regulator